MEQKNQQIDKFLDSYYSMKASPQYAVMVKGKWGAGKTWFIQRSVDNLRKEGGFALYVSLYGISDMKGIDDELFRQLHPKLAGKNMVLAGRVLKGLLKGTLKIDLDGDGKGDGTLSVAIPDINLPEYLNNAAGQVLIFDDIERCTIPIVNLLGYINYFVEHGGHKVVLVANEEEIMKDDQNDEKNKDYLRIKEKLVGKTFEIEADVEGAVAAFIAELADGDSRNAIEKNKRLICDLYKTSKYKNLRNLRQALLEFERLMAEISTQFCENEQFLKDMLSAFLIYTFEIRSGNLKASEISNIKDEIYASLGNKEKRESNFTTMNTKYLGFVWMDSPIPNQMWSGIIDTGLIDSVAFNEAIGACSYFATDKIPEWRRLWDFYMLSDDEMENLIKVVADRFESNQYEEVGALFHVTGILLSLAQLGIYPKSKKAILAKAKSNLNGLTAAGKMNMYDRNSDYTLFFTGWSGLGFNSADTPEFQSLKAHFKICMSRAIETSLPKEATELQRMMETDPLEFTRALFLTNDGNNRYYDKPILKHIDPKLFVHTVVKTLPDIFRYLPSALEERYRSSRIVDLQPELAWLRKVNKLVVKERGFRKGKISGIQLGYLSETLEKCIKILEESAKSA